jgi:hypothetical protein
MRTVSGPAYLKSDNSSVRRLREFVGGTVVLRKRSCAIWRPAIVNTSLLKRYCNSDIFRVIFLPHRYLLHRQRRSALDN